MEYKTEFTDRIETVLRLVTQNKITQIAFPVCLSTDPEDFEFTRDFLVDAIVVAIGHNKEGKLERIIIICETVAQLLKMIVVMSRKMPQVKTLCQGNKTKHEEDEELQT